MTRPLRLAAIAATVLLSATAAEAQQPQPPQFPNMTFFITSTGGPAGANYGGLEGADKHCQALAEKAGAGAKTWRAYLSTQAIDGATAVNAKERIGKGPWVNAKGVQVAASVDDLHSANNKIGARDHGGGERPAGAVAAQHRQPARHPDRLAGRRHRVRRRTRT